MDPLWYFRALCPYDRLGTLTGDLIIVQPGQADAILLVRDITHGMRGPAAKGDLTTPHRGRHFLVRRLPPNYGLVGLADLDGALRCLNPIPNQDASPWRLAACGGWDDRHAPPPRSQH